MADLAGGDAYFAKTLRSNTWTGYPEDMRTTAIGEASSMIGRLVFSRTPPTTNTDNAAYEQAYCLLEQQGAGPSKAAAAIAQGIKSRTVADASESYASAAERDKDPGWINGVFYCPKALSWLTGYLGTPVRTGSYCMRGW